MEKLYLPDAPVLVDHDDLRLFHEEMLGRPVVDTLLDALKDAYEAGMLNSIYRLGELYKMGSVPQDTTERLKLEASATAIEKGMALGLTAVKFCVPEQYLELLPDTLDHIAESTNATLCEHLQNRQKNKPLNGSLPPHIQAMFNFGTEGLTLVPGLTDAVQAYLDDITDNNPGLNSLVQCGVGIVALATVSARHKAVIIEYGHILREAGARTPLFDEGIMAMIDEPADTPRLQEPPR